MAFNLKDLQDQKLLFKLKKGNQIAYKKLFHKYYDQLCFFTDQIVNENEASEEIVQDLFVNLWLKRSTLNITSSLKYYLYTACKNRAYNYLAKVNRRNMILEQEIIFNAFSTDIPDSALINDELKVFLHTAINKLPSQAKKVFELKYLQMKKQREIAQILDISENTVEKHMGNALKQLRISLKFLVSP